MSKLKLNIPKDIRDIHKLFKRNGKKLYVVGGAVRDAILGKSPKDYDLATDAKPEEVERIAMRGGLKTLPLGKSFGIIVVQTKEEPEGHEIATFRKDIGKGRRPDRVDYTDIYGDVKRRDLTINALFYDLDSNEIVDLVGGIADLKKKRIATVGEPNLRYEEDPLRKMRTLRFAGLTGGRIATDTLASLKRDPSLKGISAERIRDEFLKGIAKSKSPMFYFKLVDSLKFWPEILPGFKIHKRYIDGSDTTLQLAWLLQDNKSVSKLNKLKYLKDELTNVEFLHMLLRFKPEDIQPVKKKQERCTLSTKQIQNWGRIIGDSATVQRIIKHKLSVSGDTVMAQGFKKQDIGTQIRKLETDIFLKMNEYFGKLSVESDVWWDGLTKQERLAVKSYKVSSDINQYLGKKLPQESNLKSAIKKAKKINTIVYRAINLPNKEYTVGDTTPILTFFSTSLDRSIAKRFASVGRSGEYQVVGIFVKNVRGALVDASGVWFDDWPTEDEILFAPGNTLVVKAVDSKGMPTSFYLKPGILNEMRLPDTIKTAKDLIVSAPPDLRKRVMALKTVPQNLKHHPEGNVLKHTLLVVNNALKHDDVDLAVTALLHDVGKDATFKPHPKTGQPTAYGHEMVSARLAKKHRKWIKSVGANPVKVMYMIQNHMRVKQLSKMRPFKQKKMTDHPQFSDLKKFSDIDNKSRYTSVHNRKKWNESS